MTSAGSPDLAVLLDAIVRRHGRDVLDDRSKLHALLRDYAPGATRDVRVVMAAVDAGVTGRLARLISPDAEAAVGEERTRIVEGYGCRPDLAEAAVRTWARVSRSLADHPVTAVVTGVPLPLPTGVQPLPAGMAALPAAVQTLPVTPQPLGLLSVPGSQPALLPGASAVGPGGAGWLSRPFLPWSLAILAAVTLAVILLLL